MGNIAKTIDQIHKEVAQEKQEKALSSMQFQHHQLQRGGSFCSILFSMVSWKQVLLILSSLLKYFMERQPKCIVIRHVSSADNDVEI